jgi:hypothetical protein
VDLPTAANRSNPRGLEANKMQPRLTRDILDKAETRPRLTRDILDKAETDRISEAKVAITVVGGKVAYERGKGKD